MNVFRTLFISAAIISTVFFVYQAEALGPKVSEVSGTNGGNKHNLSAKAWPNAYPGAYSTANLVANPNTTYKATDDPTTNPKGQQICIFCHTPHNANVVGGAPLWNRRFSAETFQRYSSGTLQIRVNSAARTPANYDDTSTPAWQPDGSSKLCLSCHDGSDTADHRLGDVLNGGPIAMSGATFISGLASFNPTTNKMKLGHHPVSFVYNDTVRGAINTGKAVLTYVLPVGGSAVKLDKNNKMQCTTCHNPHQNQSDDDSCYDSAGLVTTCVLSDTKRKVVPFWVLPGTGAVNAHDAVCTTCHPLTGSGMLVGPNNPSPNPFPVSPL